MAEMYNGTKANEVAKILEELDGIKAANILARMQKKKASKVIEAMNAVKAAEILKSPLII
jgi:flagellar motility protein MotE (MotC chaperone)